MNRLSEQALADLAKGEAFGVFIDETGSPGLKHTPSFLHPERKTWVAVAVSPVYMPEILQQFGKAIGALQELTGAREFHFVDIYGGRNAFKDVPLERRLGLFRFMAFVIRQYGLPLFVQTLDPTSPIFIQALDPKSEVSARLKAELANESEALKPEILGHLHTDNHEHLALLLLLIQLRWYLRRASDGGTAHVFIDEGLRKWGSVIRIAGLGPEIRDGAVYSESSAQVLPLQLADFAAFGLNRTQLILGKETPGSLDYTIAQIYEEIVPNWQNIQAKVIDFGYWDATTKRPN